MMVIEVLTDWGFFGMVITMGLGLLFLIKSFIILTVDKEQLIEHINLSSFDMPGGSKENFILGIRNGWRTCFIAYKVNEDGSKEYYKMPVSKTRIFDILDKGDTAHAEITLDEFRGIEAIRLFVPQNTMIVDFPQSANHLII